MITNLVINTIVMIVGAIFSNFDIVTELPTINGFDIDATMVQGIGYINTIFSSFWPLGIMFKGFLVIFGYYGLKLILRLFIGHRAPGH